MVENMMMAVFWIGSKFEVGWPLGCTLTTIVCFDFPSAINRIFSLAFVFEQTVMSYGIGLRAWIIGNVVTD